MKLDQIAFYARNANEEYAIKRQLGLLDSEWKTDFVTGEVWCRTVYSDKPNFSSESEAKLQFNYDRGIEIEILTYLHGPHWHLFNPEMWMSKGFISHLGYHLDPDEDFPQQPDLLVQEMVTKTHTNNYVVSRGRHYHYMIFDTRQTLGCYSKYIKRLDPK